MMRRRALISLAHNSRIASAGVIAATVLAFSTASCLAQASPPACIADLKKDYGATPGLNANCESDKDCTFIAPPGNASARALVGAIAERVEACFKARGLTLASEDAQPVGVTRNFKNGDEAECALLISTPSGGVPEGVRAVCR